MNYFEVQKADVGMPKEGTDHYSFHMKAIIYGEDLTEHEYTCECNVGCEVMEDIRSRLKPGESERLKFAAGLIVRMFKDQIVAESQEDNLGINPAVVENELFRAFKALEY